MSGGLLEGIKVADFTAVIVGPLTTKVLADYGAQVIRIGSSKRPEPTPPGPGGHIDYNTGKKSITLNLATPQGIALAKKLVAWADIVTENFAGGVMKKMGLGYDDLKMVKPDIIMMSSCLQGQSGPHANQPGFGAQLTALSGINYITGWSDRQKPVWLHSYTDFVAPHFNVFALLAALDYRRRTGKGQYIDMSQYENSLHFMAPLVLDYSANKRIAAPMGNRIPHAAPHGAYLCKGDDRWCAIAVMNDAEWRSFCGVIGNPAWTTNPKFATLKDRKANEDELDRLVETWTIQHTPAEVMANMQAAGVAAGVLQTEEEMIEQDPQFKHRSFYHELDLPDRGRYMAFRPGFVLSKVPCEVTRPPLLGENSDYVLREILKLSDEEITQLVVEGALE
ncbi:MAG: CoA transferase [Dehalococcoidales bacterium]|nr:CoA transferase [Dehalococcoidales bacterium]